MSGGDVNPKMGLMAWLKGRLLGTGNIKITPKNCSLGISITGQIPPVNGGLGISTTPTNGMVPIGNGSDYTAATLTQGTGITITNGAGSITIAATGGGGSGTVTSVAMTGDGTLFNSTVSGSPITASGTLAPALLTQTKNLIFAGPSSGAAAAPTFRTSVAADQPSTTVNSTGNLSPLFTSSISAQALTFTLSSVTNPSWFGANGSTTPAYQTSAQPISIGGTGTTTAPSSGQIMIAQSATVYSPASMAGDATIANTGALTLTTVNSNVGTFTNATITVNGKGLITAAINGSGGSGTITSSTIGEVPVFTAATTIGGNSGFTFSSNQLTVGVSGSSTGSISAVGSAASGGATASLIGGSGTAGLEATGKTGVNSVGSINVFSSTTSNATIQMFGATSGSLTITSNSIAGSAVWVGPTVNITEPTALPAVSGEVMVATTAGFESFVAGVVATSNTVSLGTAASTSGTLTILGNSGSSTQYGLSLTSSTLGGQVVIQGSAVNVGGVLLTSINTVGSTSAQLTLQGNAANTNSAILFAGTASALPGIVLFNNSSSETILNPAAGSFGPINVTLPKATGTLLSTGGAFVSTAVTLASVLATNPSALTHSLGYTPILAWALLTCTSANGGYTIGQVVQVFPAAGSIACLGIAITSTTIKPTIGANFTIPSAAGGGTTALAGADWNIQFCCI